MMSIINKPNYRLGPLRMIRTACRDILDMPDIVEAKILEGNIRRLASLSIEALAESCDMYREFIELPGVRSQFESWLETKQKIEEDEI